MRPESTRSLGGLQHGAQKALEAAAHRIGTVRRRDLSLLHLPLPLLGELLAPVCLAHHRRPDRLCPGVLVRRGGLTPHHRRYTLQLGLIHK